MSLTGERKAEFVKCRTGVKIRTAHSVHTVMSCRGSHNSEGGTRTVEMMVLNGNISKCYHYKEVKHSKRVQSFELIFTI